MIFNSLEYFLFLPAVWLVHYFLGQRLRWLFLLTASLIFYASLKTPYLLGVIVLVTVVTYGFGRWIHRAVDPWQRKLYLWGGIAGNLLVLTAMKYVPFLTENLNLLLQFFDSPVRAPHMQLLVAIGVSYYIFQAISYLSDIYLEIEEPEPHFGYFALYLAFFPKLLQGPIERARDLLPQLKQPYAFDYDSMRAGLLLFIWGLFKKVVLADRLGLYVDVVYDDVQAYQGLPLLLATYAYALQIYFDFSGYTDMALGTARLFNIRLTDNFNRPYLATSIADFWRRWHITFSRWILDYIFKPLQMAWRGGKEWGTAAALVVTFFASGLWHGASWGFIVWGMLHGTYMACSVFYRPYQKKLHKALKLEKTRRLQAWQVFVTFNMVCFAWVFFRSSSLTESFQMISNMFAGWSGTEKFLIKSNGRINFIILLVIGLVALAAQFQVKGRSLADLYRSCRPFRYMVYNLLVLSLIFLAANTGKAKFLYFQF